MTLAPEGVEPVGSDLAASHALAFEPQTLPRRMVLDTPVDFVDHAGWLYCIGRWLSDGTPGTAVGVNANLVNLVHTDPAVAAAVHEAQLAYPDGKSVVWAAQALGWPVPERLATTDLVGSLCDLLVERGASVFLLGGEPGLAAEAAADLERRHPGLQIAGTEHGFHPAAAEPQLIERINASRAQVLLVGLGDPLQQLWVARNRSALDATAVLTCGGLFNWITERHPRPPQWVVNAGLEWAWRLLLEPRRLWRRYLIGNPVFLARLGRELARHGRMRPEIPTQWSPPQQRSEAVEGVGRRLPWN
jgi:N-acetylglucosaminyldiphosphoundecaprenol N-acetyl-beta-D-mannosaminyltransferase